MYTMGGRRREGDATLGVCSVVFSVMGLGAKGATGEFKGVETSGDVIE
ncbi:hypothetical protein GCM10007884_51370 [Methylobacterium brachythecii]|uniref:Uncharacterized protein n=1 Tax=Methylobacterium brachythecii TaxID=1176177 RepID=A0ABQ6D9T8_9HYPH|nr:hypothetical protein GCM10007884_51370 [Methylobacterium brachythecii]